MLTLLNERKYRLCEIKKENWQPIEAGESGAIAAFVDGGNACLIKTPAAELHKIRTAVVVVSGKKITAVKQKEGYVLARAQVAEGKLKHITEVFDSDLDYNGKLEIEAHAAGNEQETPLGKAAETARKLSELAAARKAASILKGENKFVVMDGTLETFGSEEKKGMENLRAEAAMRNVNLGAVAKTCSLLTDKGESLIDEIAKIAQGTGYIRIAEGKNESHHAEISVAKLNSSASYVFRIEAATAEALGKLVLALKIQSNDVAFPGYPYGLVMADKLARVSEAETELLKAKTRATATSEIRQMLTAEKALDAHKILDSM